MAWWTTYGGGRGAARYRLDDALGREPLAAVAVVSSALLTVLRPSRGHFFGPLLRRVSHKKADACAPRGAETRAGLSRHLLAPPLGRPGRTTKSWDCQNAMPNPLSFSICPLSQRRRYREVNPPHCGCSRAPTRRS